MKKRKQHYVWQHYLRSWTNKGGLWCQRQGARFRTGTGNVAHRHDFYRLRDMSDRDIQVTEALIARMSPMLQQFARNWIMAFRALHDIRREYERQGIRNEDAERQLDAAINNLEENLHASIEGDSVALLRALRSGDVRVLADDEQFLKFAFFLAMQYFRTPRLVRRVTEATAGTIPGFDIDAAWGVLRTIFATNVGYGIYARRRMARLTFLDAAPGKEFLTGDQPVINLRAVGLGDGIIAETLELYYPLDPGQALLVNFDADVYFSERRSLTAAETIEYNQIVIAMSEEQVYARTERALDVSPGERALDVSPGERALDVSPGERALDVSPGKS